MDAARERGKKERNDPREKWGVQRIAFHAELGIDPEGRQSRQPLEGFKQEAGKMEASYYHLFCAYKLHP